MLVKMVKEYKNLKPNTTLNVIYDYAIFLVKKGVAKIYGGVVEEVKMKATAIKK